MTVISILPMYSPGQVTLAAFLGGPLGGGWLLALNYRRLAEPGKARAAIALSVLALAALGTVAFLLPEGAASPLAIVPVVTMLWVARQLQGRAYERHVAVGGSAGSSWRAAGVGLVGAVITLAAFVAIGIGAAMLSAPHGITVGNARVLYTGGATRVEAEAVGQELLAQGYGREGARFTVELTRDRGRNVVAFVMTDAARSDDRTQLEFHRLAESLSDKAFEGSQVDIWLTDSGLEPRVKLRWEARPRSIDLGGGNTITYQQGATELEARGVAEALENLHHFEPGANVSAVVKRVSLRPVVELFFADAAFTDPAPVMATYRRFLEPLSSEAFGGKPVDVWLDTVKGEPRIKLVWEDRAR